MSPPLDLLIDLTARLIAELDQHADEMTDPQRATVNTLARRFKDNAHAAIMRAARSAQANADIERLASARKVRP